MPRRARAHRAWWFRRLVVLGGSAAATATAAVLQAGRLREGGPGGSIHAAVLGAVLVVLAIQAWLLVRLLAGPGRGAPAWKRHEHRASVREAPVVCAVGAVLALGLVGLAPHSSPAEAPAPTPDLAFRVVDFGRPAAPPPPAPAPAPAAPAPEPPPLEPAPIPEAPTPAPEPPRPEIPRIEIPPPAPASPEPAVTELDDAPAPRPARRLADETLWPTRPPLDYEAMMRFVRLGLPPGADDLPPMQATLAGLMVAARGKSALSTPAGRLDLDLGKVHDSDELAPGLEAAFEFPISPDQSVLVRLLGIRIQDRGRFSEAGSLDGVAVSEGDGFEVDQSWTHLFTGYSKRLFGFRRDAWFDLAVHLGASLDQTRSSLELPGRLEGETAEGERGWAAPAAGITIGFWSPYSGALKIDLFQTVPVNLGGQTISQTDFRLTLTQDVSERVSVFLGYRWVTATYRTFEDPWRRTEGRTATELQLGGPLAGIDVRF